MPHIETKTAQLVSDEHLDRNTLPSISLVLALDVSIDPRSYLVSACKEIVANCDEIILLITGTSAPSQSIADDVRTICQQLPNRPSSVVADLTFPVYPHLYQIDSPETYLQDRPTLDACPVLPTTGKAMISSWSCVYELGQALASSEWSVFLRDDEILQHANYLRSTCQQLMQSGRTTAYAPHHSPSHSRYQALLTRCRQGVSWIGSAHAETSGNPTIISGSLFIHGTTNRSVEMLKILYARARQEEFNLSPTELAQLASVAHQSGPGLLNTLPLSASAADLCIARSEDPETISWASASKGRWYFHHKNFGRASDWYEKSVRLFPNWKSALRLSRSRFMEQKWRSCLEAYNLATDFLRNDVCLLDDGRVCPDWSLTFVASALDHLSMKNDARSVCSKLTQIFPASSAVSDLTKSIG